MSSYLPCLCKFFPLFISALPAVDPGCLNSEPGLEPGVNKGSVSNTSTFLWDPRATGLSVARLLSDTIIKQSIHFIYFACSSTTYAFLFSLSPVGKLHLFGLLDHDCSEYVYAVGEKYFCLQYITVILTTARWTFLKSDFQGQFYHVHTPAFRHKNCTTCTQFTDFNSDIIVQ